MMHRIWQAVASGQTEESERWQASLPAGSPTLSSLSLAALSDTSSDLPDDLKRDDIEKSDDQKDDPQVGASTPAITRQSVIDEHGDLLACIGNRNFPNQADLRDEIMKAFRWKTINVLSEDEKNRLWCWYTAHAPPFAKMMDTPPMKAKHPTGPARDALHQRSLMLQHRRKIQDLRNNMHGLSTSAGLERTNGAADRGHPEPSTDNHFENTYQSPKGQFSRVTELTRAKINGTNNVSNGQEDGSAPKAESYGRGCDHRSKISGNANTANGGVDHPTRGVYALGSSRIRRSEIYRNNNMDGGDDRTTPEAFAVEWSSRLNEIDRNNETSRGFRTRRFDYTNPHEINRTMNNRAIRDGNRDASSSVGTLAHERNANARNLVPNAYNRNLLSYLGRNYPPSHPPVTFGGHEDTWSTTGQAAWPDEDEEDPLWRQV